MASAYTTEQLTAYESYVGLPAHFRQAAKPELDLAYLTSLHVHQLSTVPYENLILHYSRDHAISLDPQVLFRKIVTDARGRGGYCMETSIFYNHVLKGLGFQVYLSGVRIRPRVDGVPGGDYTGWVHVVNIITLLDDTKWMIDVGFGGDGPTKPILLTPGIAMRNLGTQEVRLLYEPLPKFTVQSQKHWIYQYRNTSAHEWNSLYAFSGLEFMQADFEIMNYFTSTNITKYNFQTRVVIAIAFLRGEVAGEMAIVGKVMLANRELKRNLGSKTILITTCTTDEERVKLLEEYFNITLTEDEIQGVKGEENGVAGCLIARFNHRTLPEK